MNRSEFLKTLGLGAAFVLTTNCFQSCAKEYIGPIDFTVDLNTPAYTHLRINGEYEIINSVVVAKTINGNYVAATVVCSHEQRREVVYDQSNDIFYCTAHGAEYTLQGKGLNSNGSNGLTVYTVELSADGNTLRVHN